MKQVHTKAQIVRRFDLSNTRWRGEVTRCPFCRREFEYPAWEDGACLLVLAVVAGKRDSVPVVSRCPHCRKRSWRHYELDLSDYTFGRIWHDASVEEKNRRRVAALREWKAGLCGLCKRLEAGKVGMHVERSCEIGFGGAVTECDQFISISHRGAQKDHA